MTDLSKRLSDERHRARCVYCGSLRGPGSAWRSYKGCHLCARSRQANLAHQRKLTIERLWLAGLPLKAIALELGTSTNSIGTTLAEMRRPPTRWNVPRRRGRR